MSDALNYILTNLPKHDTMLGFTMGIAALSFFSALFEQRRAKVEDHWRAYADAQTSVLWYISALLLILVTK